MRMNELISVLSHAAYTQCVLSFAATGAFNMEIMNIMHVGRVAWNYSSASLEGTATRGGPSLAAASCSALLLSTLKLMFYTLCSIAALSSSRWPKSAYNFW